MPKAERARIAQSKSAQGDLDPMVALILNSHLKEYTFGPVRDYLRMYSAECHGLNSRSMRSKAKFVLQEIGKLQNEQSSTDEQSTINEPEQPAVNELEHPEQPTSAYDEEFLRKLDERPFVALKNANWTQFEVTPMHWMHPIPHLFRRIPAQDYPKALGHSADKVHPGEPPHEPFDKSLPLTFDHHSIEAYDSRLPHFVPSEKFEYVVDVSRKIYPLNPNRQPHGDCTKKRSSKQGRSDKDKSVALIARALLSSGQFVRVLPVRLEQQASFLRISCHYGLVLTFASGKNTILPLSVWFLGAQVSSTYKHLRRMDTWVAKQWLQECPGLEALLNKFNNCPVLHCQDVRLADKSEPKLGVWSHRRYATTWSISHSLSSVQHTAAAPNIGVETLKADLDGWHLYSNITLLAHKIAEITREVEFHGEAPAAPFENVTMETFDFIDNSSQVLIAVSIHTNDSGLVADDDAIQNVEFDDPVTETLLSSSDEEEQPKSIGLTKKRTAIGKRGKPVDGRRACAYHFECTLHPRTGSIFCLWHHRIVVHQRPQCLVTTVTHALARDLSRQSIVTFKKPQSSTQWNNFRSLRKIAKNYVVWLVDTEFFIVPGYMVVPWQFVVRDASSGAIVFSTLVDYNSMSITEMVDKLKNHHVNDYGKTCTYSTVSKRYQGTHTTGLSLGAIGEALVNAGFHADTHRVLSWYSSLDMQVFTRAINNDSDFLKHKHGDAAYHQIYDVKGQSCLQPVNLGPLLKHCTNFQTATLGYVHRSLFPGKYFAMHDADNDTLAMYEVYQRFLSETQGW